MSEDDLIEAAPCKLRNGDWGCKTQEPVKAGDTVRIVTRANKQWRAQITQVVWTDDQVCICATDSDKQKGDKSGDADKTSRTPPPKHRTTAGSSPRAATAEPTPQDDTPAPPRNDVPPTDELDAMADSAASEPDDFDDLMNSQHEFERNS